MKTMTVKEMFDALHSGAGSDIVYTPEIVRAMIWYATNPDIEDGSWSFEVTDLPF